MLDRAELLDPFLPVYVVEERMVANWALERYEEVVTHSHVLSLQTRRTRYPAALLGLGEMQRARDLLATARSGDPSLSLEYVRGQEMYRDPSRLAMLLSSLRELGIPESPSTAEIVEIAQPGSS